jgi:uncharacterized protein YdeI (YjbR/CyaY-like superfamily)
MENLDPRVDAYIAKTNDFAKPILIHLRQLVHTAYPDIVEGIKWSMPFFDFKGPVCQMAAFKQHAAFGFWRATMLTDPHKILNKGEEQSAGSIGRLTSLADLPADEILIDYIREAVELNKNGEKGTMRMKEKTKTKVEKKEAEVPEEFINLLDANPVADEFFNKFSPSKQREYLDWFADAKTEATRSKRILQALEWISEGKSRNWKYQNC